MYYTSMTLKPLLALALAAFTSSCASSPGTGRYSVLESLASPSCETGIYTSRVEGFLTLTETDAGHQYAFDDGRIGGVSDPDTSVVCGEGYVVVGETDRWARLKIKESDTRFRSGDVILAGRLIEPPGANSETPMVVYAHGSEPTGWIGRVRDPYQMVGRGVTVFVYDKRGGGLSEGRYTQNFPLLADDLVAASHEAKRLAAGRFGRFGLFGLSQGGWIAPLAAERAQAQFLGIGYGLVVDIREEDAAQVAKELRDAGYGPDVLVHAKRITDVTARLAASRYTDGLGELAEIQNEFGEEPWFARIQGSYTGVFLNMSVEELRDDGIPRFDQLDIDWSLDPVHVLEEVSVPQLWALAGEDREAPIDQTLERLSLLRDKGHAIRVYIFPDTDHGIWEYQEADDGSRISTRISPGYYDLMADWAKGELRGPYGMARPVR